MKYDLKGHRRSAKVTLCLLPPDLFWLIFLWTTFVLVLLYPETLDILFY